MQSIDRDTGLIQLTEPIHVSISQQTKGAYIKKVTPIKEVGLESLRYIRKWPVSKAWNH
jgi:hypothetical protein